MEIRIPHKRAYSINETGAIVNASPSTLRRWVQENKLPFTPLKEGLRGKLLFTPRHIDLLREYIAENYY